MTCNLEFAIILIINITIKFWGEYIMKKIEVVAAIIINNGDILCMQRAKSKYDYISYKYEFPGGKVDKDENLEKALERELSEEMDLKLKIVPQNHYLTVEHDYPHFSVVMHSYICKISDRCFTQKEHIDHIWLNPKKLGSLDWAGADIPIVNKLMEDMK